jgi:hypothetical protein
MFKTVCIKQWPEVRDRIGTYPVVALTMAVLAQQYNTILFPLIGLFLAADLAVQVAGDDVRWGTFEFVFTRAINRKKYFTAKFLFGLAPVAGLAALYAILANVDVQGLFWRLVSDPVADAQPAVTGEAGSYVISALALLLLYSVVFFLCSASFRESSFSSFIVIGAVATGLYTWLATYLVALTSRVTGLLPHANDHQWWTGLLSQPLFVLFVSILLLVPAAALFLLGRAFYSRCELPSEVYTGKRSSGGVGWVMLVLFVIVIVLAAFFLMMSTAPQTSGGH